MRPGELEALTWEDVDLEHQSVNVHSSLERKPKKGADTKTRTTTKTEAPRRNPLEPALLPQVETGEALARGEVTDQEVVLPISHAPTAARQTRHRSGRSGR